MIIETVMDISTLEEFCDHPDYESNLQRLEELNARDSLNLNVNLFPLFQKISSGEGMESFTKLQKFINSTLSIKDDNLLLPVELYVWRMSDALPDDSLRDGTAFWFDLLNDFYRGKGIDDMSGGLKKVADYWDHSLRYISNFADAVKEHTAGFKNPESARQTFQSNTDVLNDFRRFIFDKLQLRFKLKGIMNNYPDFQYMVQRLISLFYLSDVQICHNLNILEGQESTLDDYVNLEQLVYLNGCDYFVTNDRKIIDLVNNCPFADLKGRIISLDDFIDWLKSEKFQVEKKALVYVSRLGFEIQE